MSASIPQSQTAPNSSSSASGSGGTLASGPSSSAIPLPSFAYPSPMMHHHQPLYPPQSLSLTTSSSGHPHPHPHPHSHSHPHPHPHPHPHAPAASASSTAANNPSASAGSALSGLSSAVNQSPNIPNSASHNPRMIDSENEMLRRELTLLTIQREEYERKMEQHLFEYVQLQHALHDLERRHSQMRLEYEEEIARLRRILESAGSNVQLPPQKRSRLSENASVSSLQSANAPAAPLNSSTASNVAPGAATPQGSYYPYQDPYAAYHGAQPHMVSHHHNIHPGMQAAGSTGGGSGAPYAPHNIPPPQQQHHHQQQQQQQIPSQPQQPQAQQYPYYGQQPAYPAPNAYGFANQSMPTAVSSGVPMAGHPSMAIGSQQPAPVSASASFSTQKGDVESDQESEESGKPKKNATAKAQKPAPASSAGAPASKKKKNSEKVAVEGKASIATASPVINPAVLPVSGSVGPTSPPTSSVSPTVTAGSVAATAAPASASVVASVLDEPDDGSFHLSYPSTDGTGAAVTVTGSTPAIGERMGINDHHILQHRSVVCCVRFSKDGSLLATGSNKMTQIFDVFTGDLRSVLRESDPIPASCRFDAPPRSKIEDVENSNSVVLPKAGLPNAGSENVGGESYVRSVCFSPDGRFLATGAEDRIVKIWSLYASDREPGTNAIIAPAPTPSASSAALISKNLASSESEDSKSAKKETADDASSTAVAPTLTASNSGAHHANMDEKPDALLAIVLRGHELDIYGLDFSPDGRLLVSGSGDGKLRVWDWRNLAPLLVLGDSLHGPRDGVTSVAVSPDGMYVAAGSLDAIVRMWDLRTGDFVHAWEGHEDSVYAVAFAPDGTRIASGSLDRTIRVWDVKEAARSLRDRRTDNGKDKKDHDDGTVMVGNVIRGHSDYVLSLAYSPDGSVLVSGSKDRTVQFWLQRTNPGTAEVQHTCVGVLHGHKNSVISVAVSPATRMVASGSGDCRARLWTYSFHAGKSESISDR
eukprot:ANDGO_00073.mRNA.1 General transcriptional corepressor tupA